MQLNYFCPRWGSESVSWDDFISMVKNAGYDGIEAGIPEEDTAREQLLQKIEASHLKFIAQHWETDDSDFSNHKKSFRHHLVRLAKTKPFSINSHTGKDYFTTKQNEELLLIAQEISAEHHVTITHETHRSRFSFAAHAINGYLEAIPGIQITLDISHWICVAESLLYNQQKTVELCLPHVRHIHARIGHTQGPQVDDPRLSKWKDTWERHFEIWQQVINFHRQAGTKNMAITTEFGPPPYMQLYPANKTAQDFQFELNCYMLETLKQQFNP